MAKRQGEGFWRGHWEEWKRSGQARITYSNGHGLSVKTLSRWFRNFELKEFPQLTLVQAQVALPSQKRICIKSPTGWQIELQESDAAWIADLLRKLS